MLKALKRKFLLMTMSLISLVLLIVFAALLIGTYTQQMSMVKMSLAHALGQGFGVELPKEQFGRQAKDDYLMTTITLLLDAQGNVMLSTADEVEISDADLSSAVSAALASESGQGRLGELGLYYMCEHTTPAQLRQGPAGVRGDARTPELPERSADAAGLNPSALESVLDGLADDAPLIKVDRKSVV